MLQPGKDMATDSVDGQLKTLEKRDYIRIQRVLADADRKSAVPTIAYDYLYALREE
jgi:hypothetical protein